MFRRASLTLEAVALELANHRHNRGRSEPALGTEGTHLWRICMSTEHGQTRDVAGRAGRGFILIYGDVV